MAGNSPHPLVEPLGRSRPLWFIVPKALWMRFHPILGIAALGVTVLPQRSDGPSEGSPRGPPGQTQAQKLVIFDQNQQFLNISRSVRQILGVNHLRFRLNVCCLPSSPKGWWLVTDLTASGRTGGLMTAAMFHFPQTALDEVPPHP